MNTGSYTTPEVIEIDDEEEDVEVVFSNICKTNVNRNILFQKISQEIQLLQVMCGYKVPTEFEQFKELAKKLEPKIGEDIIHSAWQRVIKKHAGKQSNLGYISMFYENMSNSLAQTNCQVTNYNLFISPSVKDFPSPPTSSVSSFSTASSPALIVPDIIEEPHVNNHLSMHNFSSSNYGIENVSSEDKESSYSNGAQQGEFVRNLFTELSVESEIIQCAKNETLVNDYSGKSPDSFNHSNPKNKKKNSRNVKNDFSQLPKGKDHLLLEQQINSNDSLDNFESSSASSSDSSCNKNTKRTYLNHKSAKKVMVDLQEIGNKRIISSHFGIPAKIIKSKQKSPKGVSKKLYNKMKQMSEAELKEFKAEQKRIKLEQKKEFQMEQLQKIHDRLVDVLIPKYHNKL